MKDKMDSSSDNITSLNFRLLSSGFSETSHLYLSEGISSGFLAVIAISSPVYPLGFDFPQLEKIYINKSRQMKYLYNVNEILNSLFKEVNLF